jgi:hypothetical protein
MILGIYLVASISLTSLSIILTVIVLQFHYTGSYTPDVPDRLYNFFTKYVAKVIGMSKTVQIYESKRNLVNRRKSVFKPSDPEKITQLESSFLDYQNNMNSLKNDLILFTADQLHQSGLNSTKNKFRKKFNMNCGSGKNFFCTKNYSDILFINKNNTDYGLDEEINQFIDNQDVLQIKEATNINKKRKKSTANKIEDCFKKIEMFSLNIQRYINFHENQEMDTNIRNKWKLIAEIIDRFIFWIFLIITFVSTIMLLLVVPYLKNNYFFKNLLLKKNS